MSIGTEKGADRLNNNGRRTLRPSERVRLFVGKIRRLYYSTLGRSYLKKSLARRRGECIHCGACCQLAHYCPLLKYDSEGKSYCRGYSTRPANCRSFPIDEADIKDRNIIMPNTPCGYYFLRRGGELGG